MRLLLNICMNFFSYKIKVHCACFLHKWSTIIFESSLFSKLNISMKEEISYLENISLKIENVIDGGANKGDWSNALLQKFSNIKCLHLIEPNPLHKDYLSEKFANKNIVSFSQKGLSYRNDILKLNYRLGYDSHASLNFGKTSTDEICETVDCITLDDLISQLNWQKVDLLKLDLEGFDYFALLGLTQSLSANKVKIIQFEVTRSWEKNGCCPMNALKLLQNYDFDCYHIHNNRLNKFNDLNVPNFSIYSNFAAMHKSIQELVNFK
jgi:FkbM family methyltransferase